MRGLGKDSIPKFSRFLAYFALAFAGLPLCSFYKPPMSAHHYSIIITGKTGFVKGFVDIYFETLDNLYAIL